MIKHIALLTVFFSVHAVADGTGILDNKIKSHLLGKSYLYQLSTDSYSTLSTAFDNLYKKTQLTTEITDSAFQKTSLYDLVALPLISAPGQDVQFEVFGQFYDKRHQHLSPLSSNAVLYDYMEQSRRANQRKDTLAVGFGMSFDVAPDVSVKTLYSTGQIPGHGDSNFSIGFEFKN